MPRATEPPRVSLRSLLYAPGFWLFGVAALFLLIVVTRTAWLSDDAYITLRTIDNWQQGYGLRWNIAERVQVYTHPLWLFAVAAAWQLTAEPYFSTLTLSIVCAVTGAIVLAVGARSWWLAGLALVLLSATRSFVDYATSGLETPLSYLLLAAFAAAYWSAAAPADRVFRCALVAALLAVNRLDLLLLVAPALVHAASAAGRAAVVRLAAGFVPLLVWEVFALIYYGALVPNTAYAKLAHRIPPSELTAQGWAYLSNSWQADPATLAVIGLAVALAFSRPRLTSVAPALGVMLHLIYIVRIGGDFMSGRFLAPALIMAAAILVRNPSTRAQQAAVIGAILLMCVTQLPHAIARTWSSAPWPAIGTLIDAFGIADERMIYARDTGLMRAIRTRAAPHPAWELTGRRMRELGVGVMTRDSVGFFGYGAGPHVHIIDTLGLCDPLLARLPARRPWRIGHFYRDLPDGYVELLRGRTDRLRDPRLNEFYAAVRLVTRDRLWSRERWRAIAALTRRPTYYE